MGWILGRRIGGGEMKKEMKKEDINEEEMRKNVEEAIKNLERVMENLQEWSNDAEKDAMMRIRTGLLDNNVALLTTGTIKILLIDKFRKIVEYDYTQMKKRYTAILEAEKNGMEAR
jgi:hypothetical protein